MRYISDTYWGEDNLKMINVFSWYFVELMWDLVVFSGGIIINVSAFVFAFGELSLVVLLIWRLSQVNFSQVNPWDRVYMSDSFRYVWLVFLERIRPEDDLSTSEHAPEDYPLYNEGRWLVWTEPGHVEVRVFRGLLHFFLMSFLCIVASGVWAICEMVDIYNEMYEDLCTVREEIKKHSESKEKKVKK